MARAKEPPKPIYPLRHDFVASMDNVLGKAVLLTTALDTALKNGAVKPEGVAALLRENLDGLRKAMYGDD